MKFNYQARTKTGEIQTGIVEASSKEAALNLLQKHDFFVTFLEKAVARSIFAKKIRLFGSVSRKDVVTFSRQLSLMFKSQVPLVEALTVLGEQTKSANFKEKIFLISENVEGGTPFSQALAGFPKIFSSFYINIVKSGEASGTLSESLSYLADHLEREYHLISRLKGAMIYPALIVAVVIGVLLLLMYFVIPNLAKVLTETGQELPFLTRIVIGFSNFLRGWGGLVLLLVFAGIIVIAQRFFKTPQGKKIFDKTILQFPLIGSFLKTVYISRFSENLSTLITGGLPISQALEITAAVVGNTVYQGIIAQIEEEVKKGEKISSVLAGYPKEFPPLLTQMVAVGEKTGTLGPSLMNVVDFYRQEIERSVANLLSILEPLLVVLLGLIVAGIMAAVLMPLYKMTSF